MSSSSSGIGSLCSLTNIVSVNSDMNSLGQQQQPESEEDGDCLVRVDRRGKLMAWLEAWLTNREQRVVVGNAKSPWLEVVRWAKEWKMEINPSKSKIMDVGNHNPGFPYHIQGAQIKAVTTEENIGFWISDDLSTARREAKHLERFLELRGISRTLKNEHFLNCTTSE